MSTTDELAAKLAASTDQQVMIDDHLRAVAFNATLEAMDVHGRNRFTVEDSRMANSIFRILSHAKQANMHKDDIGLVPSAQVSADKIVAQVAQTTSPVPQAQQVPVDLGKIETEIENAGKIA